MFKSHAIVSQEGKQIMYLYLNTTDTEFANELSVVEPSQRVGTLTENVYSYINEKGLDNMPSQVRIMMGSLMLNAIELDSERFSSISEPKYERYTVKLGDTLHKLSQKFDISIWEIKQHNKLVGNLIFKGQKLSIPIKPKPKEDVYVVSQGDTLNGIAKMFGCDVRKVKQENNLITSRIEIGQMIKVPTKDVEEKTYVSDAKMELSEFAKKLNIDESKLKKWNKTIKTMLNSGDKVKVYTSKKDDELIAGYKFDSDTYVKLERIESGRIEIINLERYVLGVVASEMPANFSLEALKAQAVASRSYIVYRLLVDPKRIINDSVDFQTYSDLDELRSVWLEHYDEYLAKVARAVYETKNMIVTYDGAVIDAIFHPASSGTTVSAKQYWGINMPYLVSTDSPYDEGSPFYKREKQLPLKTFNKLLDCEVTTNDDISVTLNPISKTVSNVVINKKDYGGIAIKDKLHLNSLSYNFNVQKEKDLVEIKMSGWGHGVGLSQYGANGMALKGHTYEEILKHYYKGVLVEKFKGI